MIATELSLFYGVHRFWEVVLRNTDIEGGTWVFFLPALLREGDSYLGKFREGFDGVKIYPSTLFYLQQRIEHINQ